MKRLAFLFCLTVFLAFSASALSRPAQVDVSGTWVGTAEVPDVADGDKLTLVLEKSGETYTGKISDSVGYVSDGELKNVEFKENTLTFKFEIFNGQSNQDIYVTLKVEGNNMTGDWRDDGGGGGAVVLEKQKPA